MPERPQPKEVKQAVKTWSEKVRETGGDSEAKRRLLREELRELTELFNLEVADGEEDFVENGDTPMITVVAGDDKEKRVDILAREISGRPGFWASDDIEGVPMRFLGSGGWKYTIDL